MMTHSVVMTHLSHDDMMTHLSHDDMMTRPSHDDTPLMTSHPSHDDTPLCVMHLTSLHTTWSISVGWCKLPAQHATHRTHKLPHCIGYTGGDNVLVKVCTLRP